MLDERKQITAARETLKGNPTSSQRILPPKNFQQLPHFTFDIKIDGVQLFKNTQTIEFISNLVVVHSLQKCVGSEEPARKLVNSKPAIISFFHGPAKPPPK